MNGHGTKTICYASEPQPDVKVQAIQTEIGKGANHVLQSPSVNLEIA